MKWSISSSLVLGVLASTALVSLPVAAKDLGNGWSLTKMSEGQAVPYCAVTRKVDDLIVTVGRTVNGKSSLALDFGKPVLDPQKVYKLSLKPGSAERLEIEARPASARVFVLNLDNVVDLMKSFQQSPTLQVRYDDQSRAVSLVDWQGAAQEVKGCLASLDTEKKDTKTAAAPKEIAPVKDKPEPVKTAVKPAEVSPALVDDLKDKVASLEARNKELQRQFEAEREKNASARPESDVVAKLRGERDQALADLQTFKSTRDADRQASDTQRQTINDLKAKVATLEQERTALLSDADSKKAAMDKSSAEIERKYSGQLIEMQKEKADMQAQLATLQSQAKAGADKATEMAAAQARLAQAEKDKIDLQAKLEASEKIAKESAMKSTKDSETNIALLKLENSTLKEKMATLETKLMSVNKSLADSAAKPGGDNSALDKKIKELLAENEKLRVDAATSKISDANSGDDAGKKVAELQNRLDALAAENVRLRGEATVDRESPEDVAVSVAAEQPLRKQLRTLKSDLESARGQVSELQAQLERQRSGNEKALIAAAGKNPDIEQAIRRYQESEREVQRLALLTRQQKNQCDQEKKEIEYMLFDPKLAKQGQIALLNSLEDQLAQVRAGATVTGGVDIPPVIASSLGTAPVSAAAGLSSLKSATVAVSKDAPPVMQGGMSASKQVISEILGTPSKPPAAKETKSDASAVAAIAPAAADSGIVPPGAQEFNNLLQQAGVDMTQSLTKADRNPFGTGPSYRWESGVMAGLASTEPVGKAGSFDDVVAQQLQKLKKFCRGDFAAQPAGEKIAGGLQYAAYDAACIAGASSTSAALLFYQKSGQFTVISHETAPDAMDKAMEARDKLVGVIGG